MEHTIQPHSALTLRIITALLLAAEILFLWMFFAAEGVEQLAARAQATGCGGAELPAIAARFAARWRHGMAGNSPLYMPGFYLAGVLVWVWSLGRPLRKILVEGFVLTAIATPTAAGLAPLGAVRAIRSFVQFIGLDCAGYAGCFTFASAVEAIYTLATWGAGIVCSQLSVARRSLKPLWVPLLMNIILLLMRPWAINGYTDQWIADIKQGLLPAIVSLLVAPVLFSCLVLYQLRRESAVPDGGPR